MKIRRTCQDVTRLVMQSQDRRLALVERVSLWLHWLACGSCRHFRQQQALMRQALNRWKAYREGE